LVTAIMAKLESFPLLDMPVAFAAFCALVAAAAPGRGFLREALSVKPLVFVGTFSYSLYLIHAPLLQVLWQYVCEPLGMSPEQRFVLLMTLGLALILGASYLFFLMFEAPFMVSSKARAEARRAAAPVP
jgi:peptidoglycan/LPS O-acetylase OafA/YrhL